MENADVTAAIQATVLVTGVALIGLHGGGLVPLVSESVLGAKFLLLLAATLSMTYVHLALQPRIDQRFAQCGGAPDAGLADLDDGRLKDRTRRVVPDSSGWTQCPICTRSGTTPGQSRRIREW